ncbi:MAG: mechanosensitive ion channel family protein [Alphaproteobacteria bacterium]
MENLINTTMALITAYGLSVLGGIAILVIGWLAASWVGRALRRALSRWKRIDPMLVGFVATFVRYGILIFTLLAVFNQFGIQTTSLIALLGAAGLAIGLAVQGTLSHLAGGVMLLLFRPFHVGDTITVGGITGRIDDVELFTTTLISPDGVRIIMPNGKIWGDTIQNYTQSPTRRFELPLAVDYRSDLEKVLTTALDAARSDARILAEPAPEAIADALTTDGVGIIVRGWVNANDLVAVRSDLAKTLKQRFGREGLAVAFPQRLLHLVGGTAERVAALQGAEAASGSAQDRDVART